MAYAEVTVVYVQSTLRLVVGSLCFLWQQINSIAVHPIDPSYILSTSHDHTARLYDVTQTVQLKVVNPSWPGKSVQAYGGPAFGLRSDDVGGEGEGFGRCVAVLAGGPAGGHEAPVLSAVSSKIQDSLSLY